MFPLVQKYRVSLPILYGINFAGDCFKTIVQARKYGFEYYHVLSRAIKGHQVPSPDHWNISTDVFPVILFGFISHMCASSTSLETNFSCCSCSQRHFNLFNLDIANNPRCCTDEHSTKNKSFSRFCAISKTTVLRLSSATASDMFLAEGLKGVNGLLRIA